MNSVLNFSDQIFTGTKWNSFTDFSSIIPVFTRWGFDLSTLEIFPAFKNHNPAYLQVQRLHKWIILKEHTRRAVQTSGSGYGSTSTQPDYIPAPPTPSPATWWVGLQGRYSGSWTIGAFLMQTKTLKSQMAEFPKLEGFFAQSAFPGGLSGDIFFTNDQNTFCFIFHYYCFLGGFCFMGKFRIGELCSKLEWHEISKSSSKRKTFLLSRTLFISRLPFLQSERGQIILWLCALMCF